MVRKMKIRTQTILISNFIPAVFSFPSPQQNVPPYDSQPDGNYGITRNRVLYWVAGVVGIAVFVEIIYWMFRCANLLKKNAVKNNNNQCDNNNNGVNRRRGLFDTPSYTSYAGSIGEQLPPYEGFSLPKYNSIIIVSENNENIEGTIPASENIQIVDNISDTNNTNTNSNTTNSNITNSTNTNSDTNSEDSNSQSTLEPNESQSQIEPSPSLPQSPQSS